MPKFNYCLDWGEREEVISGEIEAESFEEAGEELFNKFIRNLSIVEKE